MSAGYIVVFKPTLEYGENWKTYTKGDVDVGLVLHAMIKYPNYSISSVSLYFTIIELTLIFVLIESILNYFLNTKIKLK